MWSSIVTIFVALCYGVLAGGRQQDGSLNNNEDEWRPIERNEATSNDQDFREGSQNSFYPSYSPYENQPLGHSRPFYYNNQQEAAYSQRSQPYQNSFESQGRYSGYKGDYTPQKSDHLGILGSGNFGVIPGGTFYNDNDGDHSNYDSYDSYLHNGHGRPSFYSNPKPYPQEQFADFRDFADINTPSDRQYSQYVIVYVPSKNGTTTEKTEVIRKTPKNIMESLTMLDLEQPTDADNVPQKKLSKSKRKLALLKPEKKYLQKKKAAKDLEEPLLALS
ncbi:uncharacterized protein [Leptinotarsa decemlineata]|uniref:uncharacterized protein n=1 Tax=Leptinotarsa decemlineata TaxID=7539 RepID=UPI003D306252